MRSHVPLILTSKLIIIKKRLLIITIFEIRLQKQMNTTTSTISTLSICNLFIFVTGQMPI